MLLRVYFFSSPQIFTAALRPCVIPDGAHTGLRNKYCIFRYTHHARRRTNTSRPSPASGGSARNAPQTRCQRQPPQFLILNSQFCLLSSDFASLPRFRIYRSQSIGSNIAKLSISFAIQNPQSKIQNRSTLPRKPPTPCVALSKSRLIRDASNG